MTFTPPITIVDRLLAAAALWSQHNDRSDATLGSRVARDGKFFERLRSGRSCSAATADRFFAFFRDPANWPDGEVPNDIGNVLDGVDLGQHATVSTDTGAHDHA